MYPADSDSPPTSRYDRYLRTDHLQHDLRRRSVRGGAATVGAQLIKHFVIALAATAILARLLTPADFGLLAMVAGFTNFLARFKELGLAMATVQRKEITHDQVSTLFWINLGLGVFVTLLAAAFAPVVAWFFGEPRLTTITVVFAIAFIFGGLTVQHQALLRRQMRFTVIAAVQIISSVFGAIAGIIAALLGAGYWALVVMQLTSTVAGAIGVWAVCGWRPGWPVRGAGVRSMLAFGGNLTGANLLNYLVRNLDNVLIGWRWGADALGLYAKAYQLLLLPIRQLNAPLTSVAIPALSRLQDQPAQYVAYYKRGIELITMVGMPLVVFTLIAADKVLLLILGDQWMGAVPIFRVLGPAAFLGTFNVATGWVYVSLGHTRRQLYWAALSSIVTVTGFVVGLRWGAIGVATAFSIVQLSIRLPGLIYCYRGTFLKLRDVGQSIWRPAVAAAMAAGAVLATHQVLSATSLLPVALLFDLSIYGLFYILCWLVLPDGLRRLRGVLALFSELGSGNEKGGNT